MALRSSLYSFRGYYIITDQLFIHTFCICIAFDRLNSWLLCCFWKKVVSSSDVCLFYIEKVLERKKFSLIVRRVYNASHG